MGTRRREDRHRLRTAAALVLTIALTGCGGTTPSGTAGTTTAGTTAATPATTPTRTLTPPPRPPRSPVARPEPEPEFSWTVRKITKKKLGRSWRRGCPVPPAKLRAVSVGYWGFDGKARTGVLVLHQDVVTRTRAVFEAMFDRRFPVRRIRPVTAYRADDDASMAADNTSAFNCRRAVAAGPPSWSRHAYGRAIDVNPVENPYLFDHRVLPPAGKAYTDRSAARPGLIRRGDRIHAAFRKAGYRWGGEFSSPDYQHFNR